MEWIVVSVFALVMYIAFGMRKNARSLSVRGLSEDVIKHAVEALEKILIENDLSDKAIVGKEIPFDYDMKTIRYSVIVKCGNAAYVKEVAEALKSFKNGEGVMALEGDGSESCHVNVIHGIEFGKNNKAILVGYSC